MQASSTKLRKRSPHSVRQRAGSLHWLFRSNIPSRRTSFLPTDIRKRNFFGMGEIVDVLTNVRSSPPEFSYFAYYITFIPFIMDADIPF